MGEIKEFYLFIYFLILFSVTHLQVTTVDRFSRLMAQMMWTRARVSLILLLIFEGGKSPKKLFLGHE